MSITSAKFVAFSMVLVGSLLIGNQWATRPAAANADERGLIALEAAHVPPAGSTFVALLEDDPEETLRSIKRLFELSHR